MTRQTKKFLRDTLLLTVGGLLSYLLIPVLISRYQQIGGIREARIKKAVIFGDRNTEINSKLNSLITFMEMFHSQNVRMRIRRAELREAQNAFRKEYTERYVALDATAWWWQSDMEREAGTLKQLSLDEMKQLDLDLQEYTNSLAASTAALRPLWHVLSSANYSIDPKTQKAVMNLQTTMQKEISKQYQLRNEVIQKVALLFSESNFRTGKFDMYRIWQPL